MKMFLDDMSNSGLPFDYMVKAGQKLGPLSGGNDAEK
jgi:hypothetical protein